MKIAVCVKQVPDTWAEKQLRAADSTLDRESADGVMNELDEYAVEEALEDVAADASLASLEYSFDCVRSPRAGWVLSMSGCVRAR
jgi:hypothetical protein